MRDKAAYRMVDCVKEGCGNRMPLHLEADDEDTVVCAECGTDAGKVKDLKKRLFV